MKVCILSTMNIIHTSMIMFYETILKTQDIDYDIVYFDRYGIDEQCGARNKYVYTCLKYGKMSKLRKVVEYLKYRKWAMNIINNNKYEFLVVWRSETAQLFGSYLYKKYAKRYCLNIRDYFYEDMFIFMFFMRKLVKGALFSTISSAGYREFLPNSDYLHIHSYNEVIINDAINRRAEMSGTKRPIVICYIGYVRFNEINKKLLDVFANDDRFKLQFFGKGSLELEEYSLSKGIKNIEFIKGFPVERTGELLSEADIINNVYGNGCQALDYAISIRFYYSVFLGIPILVSPNTYMEKESTKYGFGFSVDLDDPELCNRVYSWYTSINMQELRKKTQEFSKEIVESNRLVKQVIQRLLEVSPVITNAN